jgi:hypothetical protein
MFDAVPVVMTRMNQPFGPAVDPGDGVRCGRGDRDGRGAGRHDRLDSQERHPAHLLQKSDRASAEQRTVISCVRAVPSRPWTASSDQRMVEEFVAGADVPDIAARYAVPEAYVDRLVEEVS